MKLIRLHLLVSLVLINSICLAQSTSEYSKVKYFFGDSITSWNEIISCMEYDNHYYFICDVQTDSMGFSSGLVKTDTLGNQIKNILFREDSIAYNPISGNPIFVDNDSNIVLIGNYIQNEWGGCLTKMDKDLNVIWHKRYWLPDSFVNYVCDTPRHVFSGIKQDIDNNYLISGKYYHDCLPYGTHRRAFFMKVDSLGNTIWLRNYPTLGFIDEFEILPDSSYLVSEHSTNGLWSIIKFKFDGTIDWKKTIINDHDHYSSSTIALTSDSCALLAAPHLLNKTIPIMSLNILKINVYNQNIIWDKKYKIFINMRQLHIDQHTELAIAKNNDIVIFTSAFVYQDNITGYKGALVRLNELGDSLWMKYYYVRDSLSDCNLYDGFITNSGNLVAGGFYCPNANYLPGGWILKTDSMGNAPGMGPVVSTSNLPFNDQGLIIYPNPSIQSINLKIKNHNYSEYTVSIYDINGRVMHKSTASQSELQINHSLDQGMYIIQINFKDRKSLSTKFQVIKKSP